jgi:broad specificity phosphatase PhoE
MTTSMLSLDYTVRESRGDDGMWLVCGPDGEVVAALGSEQLAQSCAERLNEAANEPVRLPSEGGYVVHPPVAGGTYADRFEWTVRAGGRIVYSGSERGCRSFARRINRRLAEAEKPLGERIVVVADGGATITGAVVVARFMGREPSQVRLPDGRVLTSLEFRVL